MNHPNIASIFDFDTHDGVDFIVMELISGVRLSGIKREINGVKPQEEFEELFGGFVTELGGEVLPEPSDTKIADYLFRKQNIVAELKCLVIDQTI